MKYVLIAYFLGNIFAKNCCNRPREDYSKSKVGRFLRHSVAYNMHFFLYFTVNKVD